MERTEASHSEAVSLTDRDRSVYRQIGAYAFDLPECWPSQALVAADLGLRREAVNRSIRRLIAAGWLRIADRRWGKRTYNQRRWQHNVYELLEPWSVSGLAARRIIIRAHRRRARQHAGALYMRRERGRERRYGRFRFEPRHTKRWVSPIECACGSCAAARKERLAGLRRRVLRPPRVWLAGRMPESDSEARVWALRADMRRRAAEFSRWLASLDPEVVAGLLAD